MCCAETKNEHVKDPVCGMLIDPAKATRSSEYQGKTYFFCSDGCKRRFDNSPDIFLKPPGVAAAHSNRPPAKEGKQAEYTCPMHHEIVRNGPGDCPVCGMALEPREVTADESNPELTNMTRRLWIGAALTSPLLALMVSDLLPGRPLQHLIDSRTLAWLQFALATPVVLWGRRASILWPPRSSQAQRPGKSRSCEA